MLQRPLAHSWGNPLQRVRALLIKPLRSFPQELVAFLLSAVRSSDGLCCGRILRRRSVMFLFAFAVAFELSLSDAPSFFADPSRPNAASEITPASNAHTTSPIIHPFERLTPSPTRLIRRSASRLLAISRSIRDVFWGFEWGLLMTHGLPSGLIASTTFAARRAQNSPHRGCTDVAAFHSFHFGAACPCHGKFE